MEAISVRKDEKPNSSAASLNLPGDSALGVEGTSGHTFPDLFPPLAESPLGPFVDEEDLFDACWRAHFSQCVQRDGGTVRAGAAPYCRNPLGTHF